MKWIVNKGNWFNWNWWLEWWIAATICRGGDGFGGRSDNSGDSDTCVSTATIRCFEDDGAGFEWMWINGWALLPRQGELMVADGDS